MVMAKPAPKYEPIWISLDEARALLEANGLDRGPAGRWLEQLKTDRGPPVAAADAKPERDFFRIKSFNDDPIIGSFTRPGALIRATADFYRWGRGWDGVEISRKLLVGLWREQKRAADKKKPGPKPTDKKKIVAEAEQLIRQHPSMGRTELIQALEDKERGYSSSNLYKAITVEVFEKLQSKFCKSKSRTD